MNELDQIYEWDSEEENPPVVEIDTPDGPIPIPVDEHWHEYTEDEREIIKDNLSREAAFGWVNTREFFVNEEVSVREMTILSSFKEAKEVPDGAVVLEGDGGGQIYLTCSMEHVKCNEETLNKLLCEIDKLEWGCNEGLGTEIYYRRAQYADGVWGGMGGGVFVDELWIHPDICPTKAERIRKVINGESTSIFN